MRAGHVVGTLTTIRGWEAKVQEIRTNRLRGTCKDGVIPVPSQNQQRVSVGATYIVYDGKAPRQRVFNNAGSATDQCMCGPSDDC
jgi:hypothetical protein